MYKLNLKRGKQSFILPQPPTIAAWASVVGKKENAGPLSGHFDQIVDDPYFGEKTWELAEQKMQQQVLTRLTKKANLGMSDIQLLLSGDLLNQCVGSSMSVNNMNIPHLGLYGACSTMAESLLIASMAVSGGFVDHAVAQTSSHFAASERQYRFPLDYGGQRTPTAQWTVTGSGAVLLAANGCGPKITACTVGTVTDLGIKDANNMGAAMAPAALSTIATHFKDLSRTIDDYDLIVTGDLGQLGKEILLNMSRDAHLNLSGKLADCGCLIYDNTIQDVHCGGSGCGCSAVVLCGYLLNRIKEGTLKRILFCGTGALLSPTTVQQGMSIPGICHAISIEGGE